MQRVSVCVLLVACGGSPVVGVWRATSQVSVQSPTGGTTQQTVTNEFEITPAAWLVGGGCEAPLTFSGATAQLATPGMTCVLQAPLSRLPFEQFGGYEVADTLVIKSARFEVVSNLLRVDFSMQIRNDPSRPDVGNTWDFKSGPDGGAERVR